MARANTSSKQASFFDLSLAKWVAGVLNMLVAVVGRESLLGLILRQTRSEINSLVQSEEPNATTARAACFRNN
jgi:hypothetical protein